MSMNTEYKHIFKHSMTYMIGMISARAAGLILIPLYTHYLSPDGYGVITLLLMTTDIIALLIGMGITAAILRYYAEKDSEIEKNKVVSTALILGGISYSVVYGFLVLNSKFISSLIFNGPDYTYYFQIALISLIMQSIIEIPLAYFRARSRSVEFVIIMIVRVILQLSLNIMLVALYRMGILGILYSALITNIVISGYLICVTIKRCGLGFSKATLIQMILYGFPLIFSNLGEFVLASSGNFFLKAYATLEDVGLYALGYKFGMLLLLVLIAPLYTHWSAHIFEVQRRDDGKEVIRKVFFAVSAVSLVFIVGLSVYIKEVIRVISPPQYIEAFTVAPIICLAYYFFGQSKYIGLGLMIKYKTKYIAYATAVGATLIVILNFLLIPKYVMMGSAIAVVISFFVRFYLILYWSQKYYPISYDWRRLNILLGYGTITVVISLYLNFDGFVAAALKDTVLMGLFVAYIYFVWLNGNERKIVKQISKSPRQVLDIMTK